jgi:uncharacterized membrane protein
MSGDAPGGRLDPERFRLAISAVLTIGVVTSAALVAVGLVTGLLFGWSASLIGSGPTSAAPSDFSALPENLRALRPMGIAQLGLVVLLATPVLRVVASVIGFALEGDRLYVAVSAGVLAILLVSLFVLR